VEGMSKNSLRSPKSLFDLCVEQVCRSLPDLDGELPPGLPQDLVSAIIKSLVSHSALNGTTLRALRNCELGELSLAGCRGVKDDWLRAFCGSGKATATTYMTTTVPYSPIDMSLVETHTQTTTGAAVAAAAGVASRNEGSSCSCSTSSFISASSYLPTEPLLHSPSATSTMTILDLRGSQRLTDRGLLQLTDLHLLQIAKLDNCHSILGRGLIAFSSSSNLHTLSIANCPRLTDEGIVNLSHLTSLTALSLDGCRCLTNQSLAALKYLINLTKLDLSQCDLITDAGLEHLHDLHKLQELSLGWCRNLTDKGLGILCHQPNRKDHLQILRLSRCCAITDNGIEYLALLKQLQALDLNGCANISSDALASTLEKLECLISLDASYNPGILRVSWQGKIKNLQTLELAFSGVQDRHISRWTHLPSLRELNFDSCPIGDWAISHLSDNQVTPNLTSLDLADSDVTDLGMVHIAKFTKLTKLSLFYCNISNAGLRHVCQMECLEVLNLDSREIGDEGLYFLRNLKKLKQLDIFSGRVTDTGCEYLSSIETLESLELCGGGVGDLGCTHLAKLENLTSLNLSQNDRITNRGAAALASLTNLRALNLSNTRVNSAALRFLGGLVKLQSLALYGCRGIDDSASISLLHSELPSLKCLRLNNKKDEDDVLMMENDDDDDDDDDSALDDEEEDLLQEYQMNAGDGRTFSDAQRQIWDANDDSSSSSDNSNSRREDGLAHEQEMFDVDAMMNEAHEDNDNADIIEDDGDDIIDQEYNEEDAMIHNNNQSNSVVAHLRLIDNDDDDSDEEFHRAEGYFSDEISETSYH